MNINISQITEEEADYDVERVLDMKVINGTRHYLLKWIGKKILKQTYLCI